jgi:hypothetical protein
MGSGVRRKTTRAWSLVEVPFDPQLRTSTHGSNLLNLCAIIGSVDPKALRQAFKGDAVA